MFLKFDNSAVPIENVRQITIWNSEDISVEKVENTQIKRKRRTLKLRIELNDGSAWQIDLKPEPEDREKFLIAFLREINKRTVTDIPEVVKRLLAKEAK